MLVRQTDSCPDTIIAVQSQAHMHVVAGKASAAIDAALEAVRKHWIQKELTGAGGGPPITPAA